MRSNSLHKVKPLNLAAIGRGANQLDNHATPGFGLMAFGNKKLNDEEEDDS